jgi:hypothetical protein
MADSLRDRRNKKLTEKETRLLLALREIEEGGLAMPRHELVKHLVRKTGYTPAAINKYVPSRLRPSGLLHERGDDLVVVGAIATSEEAFGQLMSQNAADDSTRNPRDEADWLDRVRHLLAFGQARGYQLREADADAARALVDRHDRTS